MRRVTAVAAAILGLALLTVVVSATAQARSGKIQATTVTLSGWSAGKTEDDLEAGGVLQVDGDGTAAAVEDVVLRIGGAIADAVDAHDLGAEIGQQHGGEADTGTKHKNPPRSHS